MPEHAGDVEANWQFDVVDVVEPHAVPPHPIIYHTAVLDFFSHGRVGVYSNDGLKLCTLRVPAEYVSTEQDYWLRTRIVIDKGQPVEEVGKVQFVPLR